MFKMSTTRKQTQIDRASDYYEFQNFMDGKKIYQCKLCNEEKNGTKNSNLLGHLRLKHKEIYKKFVNNSDDQEDDLAIKRLKLLQHLTELVTVDKQQFSILLKPSFQKLVAEQLKELDIARIGINLSDKNLTEIKANIHETAAKIRRKISLEVKGKLVSTSIDAVQKNHRSVLGIFIQYIHNGVSKIRCIGMKELTQRHTGKYLSTVTKTCFAEYNVLLNQIVGLTTDNAGNMRALLRNMNCDLVADNIITVTNNITVNQSNDNEIMASENCDDEIAQILHSLDEDDENEIIMLLSDNHIEDGDDWEQTNLDESSLVQAIIQTTESEPIFINGVNCAAHTVQLAVKSALSELSTSHSNVINLARQVAKFLRKDSTRIEARNRLLTLIFPALDMDIRWSSIYRMVS